MRAKRTIGVVLTGFTAASAFVGCNSLVGLDQFSIGQAGGAQTGSPSSTGGGSPSTGGGGSGTGGDNTGGMGGGELDGGGDAIEELPPPECLTNVECTERATKAAADCVRIRGPADGSDGGPPGIVPAMCRSFIGKCVQSSQPRLQDDPG